MRQPHVPPETFGPEVSHVHALSGCLRARNFPAASQRRSVTTNTPSGAFLDQRLREAPGITYRRMQHLTDFEWAAPNLTAWAEQTRLEETP